MFRERFDALRWAVVFGCAVLLVLPVIRFGINFLTGATVIASVIIIVAALVFGPEPNSEGAQGRWMQQQLHALLSTRRNLIATTCVVWLGVLGFAAVALLTRNSTPSPFRVEYMTLNTNAIDLLLAKRIEQVWDKRLPAEPRLVKNDVLHFLNRLQISRTDAQWNFDEPGSYGYRTVGPDQRTDSLVWRDMDHKSSRQPGRTVGLRSNIALLGWDYSAILQQTVPDRRWSLAPLFDISMEYYENELLNGYFPSLPFSRSITIGELKSRVQSEVQSLRMEMLKTVGRDAYAFEYARTNFEHLKIYENVLGSSLPSDLFTLYLESNDTHGDKSLYYSVPATGLHVAVIENVSDTPQHIEALEMQYDRSTRLRSSAKLSGRRETIPFPSRWLKPGEVLIVPLYVELSVHGLSEYEGDPRRQRSRLAHALERSSHQVFGINYDSPIPISSSFRLDRKTAVDLLSREPLEVRDAKYVIGPAVGNLIMVMKGKRHIIREEETRDLLVAYGENIGSCPYVELGARDGTWYSAGTFLTSFVSQHSEGWDTLTLPGYDGRVMLVEKEAETTFIDYVGLVVQRPGRSDTTYSSTLPELAVADGRYLMLNPGDSIVLKLGDPTVSWYEPRQARLIGKGYFIPARRPVATGITPASPLRRR